MEVGRFGSCWMDCCRVGGLEDWRIGEYGRGGLRVPYTAPFDDKGTSHQSNEQTCTKT